MRSLVASVLLVAGCGFGTYDVVRVHDGRQRVGRFVSAEAYALAGQAALAEAQGDWGKAVTLLQKARDADPEAAELQARLGAALCKLGKREAAMFAFADALRLDPELERAYTSRAVCRLSIEPTPAPALAAAREDLERATVADPDALDPVLLLIELDLREAGLSRARIRAEEAISLHPVAARAYRALAQVCARQGEADRAAWAAIRAEALDTDEGGVARAAVLDAVDTSGAAGPALLLRVAPAGPSFAPHSTQCEPALQALAAVAAKAEPSAVEIAAAAARAACPEDEGAIAEVEVATAWTEETGEAIEARALASPSLIARRLAVRARLRRMSLDAVLASLPKAEDRATLALELAAAAVKKARGKALPAALAFAAAAFEIAPWEPTVARLCAEVALWAGRPEGDPYRVRACALARTKAERGACKLLG